MKSTLLLPRSCRIIGLVLLPLFLTLFFKVVYGDFFFSFLEMGSKKDDFDFGNHNLTDEVAIIGCIISLFMIAFSRQKHEDEYVSHVRLRSLQWGVYANYAVFLVLTCAVYGSVYLYVIYYNVATILVLFIAIFNYNLYIKPRISKQSEA